MRSLRVGHIAVNSPDSVGGASSWYPNPFKEKRLCFFAAEDDNNAKNDDDQQPDPDTEAGELAEQGAEASTEKIADVGSDHPLDIIQDTRSDIMGEAPELVSSAPKQVLESPVVTDTLLSADYLTPDQENWLKDQMEKKWLWAGATVLDLKKHLQECSAEDRATIIKQLEPLVQDVLRDPYSTWKLCHDYEASIETVKEDMKTVKDILGPDPIIDYEQIQAKKTQLETDGSSFGEWMNDPGNFDDVCNFFGMDPMDVDHYIELNEHLGESNKSIIKRIQNRWDKATRAWKVAMNHMPWGKAQEKESSDVTLEKLEQESAELRKLLDALQQNDAEFALQKLQQVGNAACENLSTDNPESFYAQMGVSMEAAQLHKANLEAQLGTILRQVEEDPAIGTRNALEPLDPDGKPTEGYLQEAKANNDRIRLVHRKISQENIKARFDIALEDGRITEEEYERFMPYPQGMEVTPEGWLFLELESEREDHAQAMLLLPQILEKWEQAVAAGDDGALTALRTIMPEGKTDEVLAAAQRVRDGEPTGEDHSIIYMMTPRLPDIEATLKLFDQPETVSQLIAGREQFEQAMKTDLESNDVLNGRLNAISEKLLPGGQLCAELDHTITNTLQVGRGLQEQIDKAEGLLMRSDKESVAVGQWIVETLEECHKQITSLEVRKVDQAPFTTKAGTNTDEVYGCYNLDEGVVYLNEDALSGFPDRGTVEATTLAHEKGHAIIDILTRRPGILAGLLTQTYTIFSNENVTVGSETHKFSELLEAQAERWQIPVGPNDPRFRDYLTDELMSKYSSWVASGRSDLHFDEDRALFEAIDSAFGASTYETQAPASSEAMSLKATQMFANNAQPPAQERAVDINQEIRDCRAHLHTIHEYIDKHPGFENMTMPPHPIVSYRGGAELVTTQQDYEDMKKFFEEEIDKPLEEGGFRDAANRARIEENLKHFGERWEQWNGFLTEMKKQELDAVNSAKAEKKDLLTMWRTGDIQFASIMDIWVMGKNIGEDWMRLWNRRGELVRARMGAGLTGWIPDDVPMVGRLKHEFNRRDQNAELDEVRQWRDAFKNVDSTKLLARIAKPSVRNKDEIKALFEELTERGRLDWNDEAIWKKLNMLSHYRMPIEPCMNDDLLRDDWLERLISDIWNDNDLFNNWKRANDASIKSEKDKFTPKVDQLANLDSMGEKLETMLRDWVEGRPGKERVNPHLYEEVVHYAIRMGKMSMEGKFYYLIRGVAEGLLSIDRLRVLAGDGGGVLMRFPFIDYFYQKNNDPAYMKALAKRLIETKDGKDTYKPGLKTTMFVRLEIAREGAVKERLRKAQSKNGENIDHDDIPYFMPELDHTQVADWYTMAGGRRLKLSFEALKNSYVGYSMKFKSMSALANMNDGNRFSDADIDDLVGTIGGYIISDNILTSNGFDKEARAKLSQSEIEQTCPVYGKSHKVSEYRNVLNGFTSEIVHIDGLDWERINGGNKHTGANEQVTADNFTAGVGPDSYLKNMNNDKLADNIHTAIAPFLEELRKVAHQNPDVLIDILSKYGAGNRFVADDVTGDDTSVADMQRAYEESLSPVE